jgi:hypothetical protein
VSHPSTISDMLPRSEQPGAGGSGNTADPVQMIKFTSPAAPARHDLRSYCGMGFFYKQRATSSTMSLLLEVNGTRQLTRPSYFALTVDHVFRDIPVFHRAEPQDDDIDTKGGSSGKESGDNDDSWLWDLKYTKIAPSPADVPKAQHDFELQHRQLTPAAAWADFCTQ